MSETASHAGWRPRHSPWLVAASVMLATFLEVLDTSIANVSLPNIAGNLSATTDEATWVLTSYLVSNAIILSSASWLARYWGRKRYLGVSVAIFVVSSAFCGFAHSMHALIFARVIQGLGGGGLQPLAQAVLLESFPPEERGAAMAAYGMGIVVAPIIGPTLGGWITDNFSWRWIFFINLPIGLAGLVLQHYFLEDPPWIQGARARRIDYPGFGLMALGVGLLQLILDKGQEADWFGSLWVRWASAASLVSLAAFVLWELEHPEPLMNLRLLKNRNFATATALMAATAAALFGSTAILPIFMQTLLGYTAYLSGLAMTPRGIGSFLSMMLLGRLIRRFDPRVLMGVGFAGLAITSWQFSRLTLTITSASISWPLFFNGLSIAFIFVPMTTLSVATLEQSEINQATGIYSLLRNLGAGIGISALVNAQLRSAQAHQAMLIERISSYAPQFGEWRSRLGPAFSPRAAAGLAYRQVLAQAQLLAFMDSFRWLTLLAVVCMPLLLLFRRPTHPSSKLTLAE